MPVLNVYISDEDMNTLRRYVHRNPELQHRDEDVQSAIERLAESSVSEAACDLRRKGG